MWVDFLTGAFFLVQFALLATAMMACFFGAVWTMIFATHHLSKMPRLSKRLTHVLLAAACFIVASLAIGAHFNGKFYFLWEKF